MAKKLTIRNIDTVVMRIKRMEVQEQKVIAAALNDALDQLLANDFFGTEGQTDPRGDWRD
jgi:hypothetical protein